MHMTHMTYMTHMTHMTHMTYMTYMTHMTYMTYMTHMTLPPYLASRLVQLRKSKAMKYILILALTVGLTACSDTGTGNRTDDKPVLTHDQPSSNPNTNVNTSDTTSHVQDSTTVIDYDTSSRRK